MQQEAADDKEDEAAVAARVAAGLAGPQDLDFKICSNPGWNNSACNTVSNCLCQLCWHYPLSCLPERSPRALSGLLPVANRSSLSLLVTP
jgi:hypothetical protein